MENLTFFKPLSRGQYNEGQDCNLDTCTHCIFSAPMEEGVTNTRITGNEEHLLLELVYGGGQARGAIRIRQMKTNLLIEESAQGAFLAFLADKPVKYMGQIIMYAVRFQIGALTALTAACVEEMRRMEDALDTCIDNSGAYDILDFRRRYTQYGNEIIDLKEILARINKGYFTMQMQNSYVLQGEVELELEFLERRYDLLRTTIIKDLDTYTSIVNNNINRSTRLLSVISLVGVVLNFMFGSFLAVNPVLGIVGGLAVAGMAGAAAMVYRVRGRGGAQTHDDDASPPFTQEAIPQVPALTHKS